jgi:hypothetical protein
VSSHVWYAMERLFDPDQPYFAAWRQLYDIDVSIVDQWSSVFRINQKSGPTPVYYAALCGLQDLVEYLIIKYPQQVKANCGCYQTPALAALAGRHFGIARLLHRNGSSVDLRGRYGNTPVFSASNQGDLEMVQLLLEYKADVNHRNDYGATPLYGACVMSLPHTLTIVQLLLENGANPNARCTDGDTVLRAAKGNSNPEVLRLLLEYGVEVVDT